MNWNVIPDIVAFGFLILAFASVLNRNGVVGPVRWLIGWLFIQLHFFALLFIHPGVTRNIVSPIVSTVALLWAGLFFMWETVPYKSTKTSRYMMYSILLATLIHTISINISSTPVLILDMTAALYIIGPLLVTIPTWKFFHAPIRVFTVFSFSALGVFLIYLDHSQNKAFLLNYAPEALAVFLICSIHFSFSYRRLTAGAIITISGMYLWSSVFILGPYLLGYMPTRHFESEVWNLPKYIVASGMILMLLENQVEFNRRLAMRDALTGLPNRRFFEDRLVRAIERAKRSGTQTALLMIDLNRFKHVNDTHGHAVGDKLLQSVSKIFSARVRSIDTVARTGGDEFAIVLEGPITRADAERIAASLVDDALNPMQLEDQELQASFAIGVALFPEDANNAEELYLAADREMYAYKESSSAGTSEVRLLAKQ